MFLRLRSLDFSDDHGLCSWWEKVFVACFSCIDAFASKSGSFEDFDVWWDDPRCAVCSVLVSGCWSFPNGWKMKVRVVSLAFSSQAGCGGMLFSASGEIGALFSGLAEVSETVINWLTKLVEISR
ncbi:hypothetical protein V6N11_032155 [Hibiscus sabdariffa]|uniref:Uncharacterized protein n=1 Tax=Hibiscus sabdariffa TaxID=183260 RepID=A0ABR2T0I7_9ROSI